MLERKRVLRVIGPRRSRGHQTYRHVRSKNSYEVAIVLPSAAIVHRLQGLIGDIML